MAFLVPKIYVPFVRVLNWAGIFTFTATRTFLRNHIAGVFADFHFKVANITVAFDEFRVGEDCNVWVTCAIHHLWAFDADAAVEGGEGFVERCHVAADALAFFEHVDFEALIGKVKAALMPAIPPPTISALLVTGTSMVCRGCINLTLATAMRTESLARSVAPAVSLWWHQDENSRMFAIS